MKKKSTDNLLILNTLILTYLLFFSLLALYIENSNSEKYSSIDSHQQKQNDFYIRVINNCAFINKKSKHECILNELKK